MYFNKEGQPSIIEVAKEQDKLPSNFPIATFLEQYNVWNNTPNSSSYEDGKRGIRQSLFAGLRDLHQQYGINSASTVFGSEEEMHAFAKYLNAIKTNQESTNSALTTEKQQKTFKVSNTDSISSKTQSPNPVSETKDTPNTLDVHTPNVTKNPKKNTNVLPKNPAVDISTSVISPMSPVFTQRENPLFGTKQSIVMKDGAYYLTGPKGNTRRVEVSELLVKLNLPKDAPENLGKSVKIIEDFSLLLDAYIAANPNQKTKYESAVKATQELFAHQDIQTGKRVLDVTTITTGMFDNFWRTFSDTDLKKVNDAFRIQDSSARRLALMNFIRKNLGQSDLVLGKIMESNPAYFAFPSDENILANSDLSAAGLSEGGRQSVEKMIRKAYLEAAGNWNKNHKEYIAQFKAQNPGVQVNEDEARKNNEKLTVLALAKREIMYQKLYNQNVTGELALAQDIMGAKTLSMSDKSWDISTEIGGMIAMEAIAIAAGVVTAGIATAGINAAMLGRNAYRGAKALEAYNAATKTRQIATTSARILGSGIGFEAGGATVRSLIENGDFTSMHSMEGYIQSVAMMGVMSGIGKLITAGKLGQGIQFKEGAGFAKNILPFTGQVTIEGAAIFGTSATIGSVGSVVFDRKDNWTLEQMGQAMLMATLFKGAGRVLAYKDSNGNVGTRQENSAPSTNHRSARIEPDTYMADIKSFKDKHITGDALYDKAVKAGHNHVQIEGLPEGYKIGMTNDGRRIEILKPDGSIKKIYADKLEKTILKLYESEKGVVNTKQENVQEPTESAPNQNQAPTQQTTLDIDTYKDIRNAVIDTLKKEDTVSIAGIVIKKGTKKGQYGWTGSDKNGASINKTGTKDQLLQSIKDDLPIDKVILDARNVRPGTVKESYFKIGEDKYLIDEAGNFRKSTASGAQNLSEAEVTTLIQNHPQDIANAIMDSHIFSNFIAKASYLNKEGKYGQSAWGLLSTEIAPTGFIKTIGGYPLNLVRLPFIQTQRVINVWKSAESGGVSAKLWDSVKILGTANSTPFANKTQGLATLLTMGSVAWGVKDQINRYNADSKNTDKIDTIGEYAYGATWRYLASLNITVPYDVAKWIYQSTVGDGK